MQMHVCLCVFVCVLEVVDQNLMWDYYFHIWKSHTKSKNWILVFLLRKFGIQIENEVYKSKVNRHNM